MDVQELDDCSEQTNCCSPRLHSILRFFEISILRGLGAFLHFLALLDRISHSLLDLRKSIWEAMWTPTAGASISLPPLHHTQLPDVSISNQILQPHRFSIPKLTSHRGARIRAPAAVSGAGEVAEGKVELRTCRNCKKMYDPSENHPRACRFHTAHFGGETKRKFESVYTGGTMDTIGGGEILQYWHCCGVADAFDPGCEAAPHMSYDD